MPKTPRLNSKKVITILKNNGFILSRTKGSHYIFSHPLNNKIVVVPYHTKVLPIGTLLSILDMAGINRKDL
ncbi:hypothetical protein A3I95_01050 [Candidatus Nomurabacteria bacterium RIFCSPLOWO2_02_FULL_44_12]|uniref:Addiction module toxin, HicA family n=1 Tax=Candidatus Nomurabacteria bacterium RIFCSPLOWO2_12_FULL_44_11 TaxID=1801796 RepID=A0A1F6Y4A8_9BACT|nr:MAG: hypothetical protein A3G53_03635 [Candidatus Nomurabacteria bacterium RIFCSPLOWO2_12_FULL_44_11]OGJ08689.1 MAG: hypothetical protein A3I95_01050 [Candidatus Nomurabacteria bacterium RIFCSPLOWO2_02_FULL_44_12]